MSLRMQLTVLFIGACVFLLMLALIVMTGLRVPG